MAATTVLSNFGAQENKVCHCFHCFPIYFPWSNGTGCHDLSFWMLSFKPAFSLSSTFIKRLFSFSSLSSLRVVSSAYLRLLRFLLEIFIPACDSSSLALCMIYSAYKLNKQADNIQLSCTAFARSTAVSWSSHLFHDWFCYFLTHIQYSQETGKVAW